MPIAAPRFYVDEDTIFLGRALAAVRDDVVYPGHQRCKIAAGAKDGQWVPLVGAEGWLLISRDRKILTRPVQRISLIDNGVRAVFLTKAGHLSRWDQMRLVVQHWERIEALAEEEGPFAYSLTSRGVSAEPLKDPRSTRR